MNSTSDLRKIKLLVLDMDGVMTDGGIYLSSNGEQMRRFHAHDGEGIKRLRHQGITVGIITGSREDDIVKIRASMLGMDEEFLSIHTRDKLEVLQQWIQDQKLTPDQVAYIGDDLPDIEPMKHVGISACPVDAVSEVQSVADIILTRAGGQGCVREFIDMLLTA